MRKIGRKRKKIRGDDHDQRRKENEKRDESEGKIKGKENAGGEKAIGRGREREGER